MRFCSSRSNAGANPPFRILAASQRAMILLRLWDLEADVAAGPIELSCCSSKDFQHVVFIPAACTAFHGDAFLTSVLLQK